MPAIWNITNEQSDNFVIRKPKATAFENTWTYNQYLFNYMSNMHIKLVHWNLLHPKNSIIPTFSGHILNFLCENHKTRTNNLHHQKAGSIVVVLSLRLGIQHIPRFQDINSIAVFFQWGLFFWASLIHNPTEVVKMKVFFKKCPSLGSY